MVSLIRRLPIREGCAGNPSDKKPQMRNLLRGGHTEVSPCRGVERVGQLERSIRQHSQCDATRPRLWCPYTFATPGPLRAYTGDYMPQTEETALTDDGGFVTSPAPRQSSR